MAQNNNNKNPSDPSRTNNQPSRSGLPDQKADQKANPGKADMGRQPQAEQGIDKADAAERNAPQRSPRESQRDPGADRKDRKPASIAQGETDFGGNNQAEAEGMTSDESGQDVDRETTERSNNAPRVHEKGNTSTAPGTGREPALQRDRDDKDTRNQQGKGKESEKPSIGKSKNAQ